MSEANGTLGTRQQSDPSLKATNMLLAFSELFISRPNLGIRSFHSLLPRLYRLVAFGDFPCANNDLAFRISKPDDLNIRLSRM